MASLPTSPPHPKKPKLTSDDLPEAPQPQRPPLPPSSPGKPKYKRRKIALFFGYCGFGYQGMQKNPGAKTIEADLEEALFRSWAVPESDRGNARRCDWARSARTDKGVSAVGQVVSGRFYVDPPGLVERLNSHLEPKIRVFGYKRVTASFNAKKLCDRRRYVYLLPLFALDPRRHCVGEMERECPECCRNGYRIVCGQGMVRGNVLQLGVGDSKLESGLGLASEKSELCNGVSELRDPTGCSSVSEANLLSVEGGGMIVKRDNAEVVVADIGDSRKVDDGRAGTTENNFETGSVENHVAEQIGGRSVLDAQISVPKGEGMVTNLVHGDPTTPQPNKVIKGEGLLVACGNVHQFPDTSSKFCYGEEEKNRFNSILKRYVGTHNFHNFTSRTKAEDPSALRYIVSFHANTVVDIQGIEFVKCEVVGQSFVLHQIRKMIGLAVAIMRNRTSESLIDSAFSKDVNVNVPTAPETGLYLDECLFTSYNKKWTDHEKLSMDSFADEAEYFKMKCIYPHIASMEQREGAVALWLHALNYHRYNEHHPVGSN